MLALQLLQPLIRDRQLALQILRQLRLPDELGTLLRELALQIVVSLCLELDSLGHQLVELDIIVV